jgi:hypothetical protein
MPQVYITTDKSVPRTELKKIREENRKINDKYMTDTANGIELKYEDVHEIKYMVPHVYDLIDLHKDMQLAIHDLPGLNDSMTKSVYHKYVVASFHKYDIVIFVVDIYSSLNTSDETDILKIILNGMKDNKLKYNLDCKLIILLNKCDELDCDETTKQCVPSDEELQGMVKQVNKIVSTCKKEIYENAMIDIMCVSCEDAYIYRMYSRDPTTSLDAKYLNKFGANEYGKTRWNKLPEVKKKSQIKKLFKEFDYKDRIGQCGFTCFKNSLTGYLTKHQQYCIIISRIEHKLKNYVDMHKESQYIDINIHVEEIKKYENTILEVQKHFKETKNLDMIEKELKRFVESYKKIHSKYVNKYTINDDSDYNILLLIKKMFMTIMKSFNYKPFVKDECMNVTESINKFTIDKINNPSSPFDDIVNNMIKLRDSNYGNDELIKLIHSRFCNMALNVEGCMIKYMADNNYWQINKLIVIKLKVLEREFILPIDDVIALTYSNLMNFVHILSYGLASYSKGTKPGPSGSSYSSVAIGDIGDEKFKRCIDATDIKLIKYAYISSLYVKTTNPYYLKICNYKIGLSRYINHMRIEPNINEYAKCATCETLDTYFVKMLNTRYVDDILFIDDIIINTKSKASGNIKKNTVNMIDIAKKSDSDIAEDVDDDTKESDAAEDVNVTDEDVAAEDDDNISEALDRELNESDHDDSDEGIDEENNDTDDRKVNNTKCKTL